MWHSFRGWLNNAPITDPIERRQAPMLQVMLIGIVIAAILALTNILLAPITSQRRLLGIAINTLYMLFASSGLAALRRGHFRLGVLIPTIGSALILGMFLIAVGLRNGAPFLIVFMIPIILAGLLTGRPSIFLVIGIGGATMLIMLALERAAPRLTGFVPVGDSTSTIAVVFIIVTSLIGLFLDRFGHTLSTTLAETLARERELKHSRAALEARTIELEREIGERLRIEAALRQSEELLRALTNTAQAGLMIVDQTHTYRYTNPAYATLFHLPAGDLVGQRMADVLATFYDQQIRPGLERAFRGERVHNELSIPAIHGGESIRHYEVTYEPGEYRSEMIVVVVVTDITERKRAELALHRSTERLHILANASRVFAEVGAQGDVLFERIARTIAELLHDFCGIRMLSADGQWLSTVALYNATSDPLDALQTTMAARPIPAATISSLWQTMQGDRALLMPALDPALIQSTFSGEDQPDMRHINDYDRLIAPLRINGQPIGVIGVTHKRLPGGLTYDEDDLRLVQDLADRAALAISNARLYQELQQSHTALEARVAARTTELANANATLQRQAMQASALATMSRALAEAGRDLQPLFDTIVQHLARLLGDTCVLSMLSDDRQWMQPVASHNVDADRNALIGSLLAGVPNRADAGWSAPVVATGQALLLPHIPVADVRKQISARYHPYFETVEALSLLIVPVRAHDTLLGMLTALRDRQDQPYTADDQTLLEDLADRAGLAIENARLFAEIEQARTEAERANHAKSIFLTSMSHELRTPLNAILGFTGTLLMRLPGPLNPNQEKQLTTVKRSAQHLLNLINDILDLAKIESGKVEIRLERVVCQAVVDEVMASLRPAAEEKGLGCSVAVPEENIVIASDQRVLSQILINLVNNAIKFTDRGEIRVALARKELDGQSRVCISVSDTGIGIAAEDQAKLFQEFGRINSDTVRAREGTGLGLRLSRKLAELLGGTITLISELSSGSTFTLELPER